MKKSKWPFAGVSYTDQRKTPFYVNVNRPKFIFYEKTYIRNSRRDSGLHTTHQLERIDGASTAHYMASYELKRRPWSAVKPAIARRENLPARMAPSFRSPTVR